MNTYIYIYIDIYTHIYSHIYIHTYVYTYICLWSLFKEISIFGKMENWKLKNGISEDSNN